MSMSRTSTGRWIVVWLLCGVFWCRPACGQESAIRYGGGVSSAVRSICERGLIFLAKTQQENGSWPGEGGPGITGICVMAFMATGEDPDYGPHADNIRKGLRYLILSQVADSGHLSGQGYGSMYHHGFALLALSEAYGVVSEELLWEGSDVPEDRRRTLGQALELAVRCAVTAQEKNPWGAWRYSPESQDADTTVSGTVLMGLLGARNAGVEVPNGVIEKAMDFFQLNTLPGGIVSYMPGQSHGNGLTRSAIATLVYAVSKRKNLQEYRTSADFIRQRIDSEPSDHPFYGRYYMAQALFHSDFDSWMDWNQKVVPRLQKMQESDGSFSSNHGKAYGTGMSVLALALNYRLLPVYER